VEVESLQNPPARLWNLFTDTESGEARDFRDAARHYNSSLSFTSVKYTPDKRLGDAGQTGGVQVFSIHGEYYHQQGPLVTEPGEKPKFAARLFYDPRDAAKASKDVFDDLHEPLLLELMDTIRNCNPYVEMYKTARERFTEQENVPLEQRPANLRVVLQPNMKLVIEKGADRRRENLPTADEVAGLITDEVGDDPGPRDLVVAFRPEDQLDEEGRPKKYRSVHPSHAAYMPLAYAILFPRGENGWHFGLQKRNGKRLGQQEFWRYRLHERNNEKALPFYAKRLFQQWLIDCFVACVSTRLSWFYNHQKNIRADVYDSLPDDELFEIEAAGLGKRVVLPASFTGSERFMQQIYQDAMAIMRVLGKPTYFITVTANPKWPEITRELKPGQSAIDRPDLVARVFKLKLDELQAHFKKGDLGKYAGDCRTIEYQKRGLPHAHILLWIDKAANLDFTDPQVIDDVVCAELPPRHLDPTGELAEIITTTMSHGPCGPDYKKAPCMQVPVRKEPCLFANDQPRCMKRYPKAWCETTIVGEDGYPRYRRRNDGRTFTSIHKGKEFVRNNSWVVPYNPFLTMKFRAHINVEICATVSAIKYIGKYIYKGADRSTAELRTSPDEVDRYVQARYIGPTEAAWRLFEFPTHHEWPPVQKLPVHLEGQQPIYFPDDATPERLQEIRESAQTQLMAYFKWNTDHPNGLLVHGVSVKHTYADFPTAFVWDKTPRAWYPRKQGTCFGRMNFVNVLAGDKFYLRMLLNVVKGAKSFEYLRWYEGVLHPTFRAACVARGIANDDKEWFRLFDEGIVGTPARQLRNCFVLLLLQKAMVDPVAIWDRYKDHLCDDLKYRVENHDIDFPLPFLHPQHDYGLFLMQRQLLLESEDLRNFGLPTPALDWSRAEARHGDIRQHEDNVRKAAELKGQLNDEQGDAFNQITKAITGDSETAHFFLQGPGGAGKTFLYKTLYYHYRAQGKRVLCVASTGIAALLLPNGTTSHSAFKLPLELTDNSTCSVSKQSFLGKELANVDLVIWDEVPMQNKHAFLAVHRLLVDLRAGNSPLQQTQPQEDPLFGGVPFLFGGDWGQILPVVVRGGRSDTVDACFQRSPLWHKLKQLRLRKNMRVRPGNEAFIQWVGFLPYDDHVQGIGKATIPEYISVTHELKVLLDTIYPQYQLQRAPTDLRVFRRKAILSTLNVTVDDLNKTVIERFPGESHMYESVNTVDAEDGEFGQIPVEFLRTIELPGLPPAVLSLKPGMPVMVLRNIFKSEGLCNGARGVITRLLRNSIEVELMGGDFDGQRRLIPRVKLLSGEKELPYTLARKQLPIKPCFAMTINKGQGQSFDEVGIDLRTPVFSHGQFYVAVSRVTDPRGLHLLLPPNTIATDNIVYPEVLQGLG
jgi:hypothetical protein